MQPQQRLNLRQLVGNSETPPTIRAILENREYSRIGEVIAWMCSQKIRQTDWVVNLIKSETSFTIFGAFEALETIVLNQALSIDERLLTIVILRDLNDADIGNYAYWLSNELARLEREISERILKEETDVEAIKREFIIYSWIVSYLIRPMPIEPFLLGPDES